MALSAADIEQSLAAVLDYEETADVTKAKQAVTYLKQLMILRRASSSHESSSHSFDIGTLQTMLDDAKLYVRAATSGGGVRFLGFNDFKE